MRWVSFKILAATFLAAVLTTGIFGYNYKSCFGSNTTAATHWPAQVRLARSQQQATLVVFLHPHCINSSVTLTELAKILPALRGKAQVYLSFYSPRNQQVTWVKHSPWKQAERMQNVNIYADINGEDSEKFGAQSSGEMFLYDKTGALVFHGGLNRKFGFMGGRAGVEALLAWIGNNTVDAANKNIPRETPVWGRNLRTQISVSLLDLD